MNYLQIKELLMYHFFSTRYHIIYNNVYFIKKIAMSCWKSNKKLYLCRALM